MRTLGSIVGAALVCVVMAMLLIGERWRARWRGEPYTEADRFMGD